jgi:hypothetical protein
VLLEPSVLADFPVLLEPSVLADFPLLFLDPIPIPEGKPKDILSQAFDIHQLATLIG